MQINQGSSGVALAADTPEAEKEVVSSSRRGDPQQSKERERAGVRWGCGWAEAEVARPPGTEQRLPGVEGGVWEEEK